MRKWMRRLRGAIKMGITWAIGWVPIGTVTGLLTGLVFGFPLMGIAVNYSVMFGVLGFLGGSIFSTVVSIADGKRRFDELALPRFATWGGLGGFILGTFAVGIGLVGLNVSALGVGVVGVMTLLGAGSATGTLALARVAESAALLEEGDKVREVGLDAGDADRLLNPSR